MSTDAFERYARDVSRWSVWTTAEEIEAGARLVAARASGDARAVRREVDRFIRHNLRLVLAIVQRYRGASVPLVDLIQEGNIGLLRAVEKFDPERGFRFCTYATWWVRQGIARAIVNDGATVRIPVHVSEVRRPVRRARARFLAATGREATTGELATMTGKSASAIARAEAAPGAPLPLDAPMGEDGSAWVDSMPSPLASQLDALVLAERADEARRLLATLGPRERDVLGRRHADDAETLAEIGERWGVCRERIRQVERIGLDALRRRVASRHAP